MMVAFSSELMTRRDELQTTWPDRYLVSCKPSTGNITFQGYPKLTPLRINGWTVAKNPEFTFLEFAVTSRLATIERWVEVLGCLGQPYNITVTTPEFKVLIERPVCTDHVSSGIFFHYLNCVPRLRVSP
jgi:hypothetical protein